MGIGDELIVTGQCREAQRTDPRKVRIVYEKKKKWYDVWDHNPRIARYDEDGDFQVLRPRNNYLRPYCSAKIGDRWTWKRWQPPRGEFYFTDAELEFGNRFAGRVILQPAIKPGAPPSKQ